MIRAFTAAISILVTGCAGSSTMPLSADTVQIVTRAAPISGTAGAQAVALKQAASETINRGYDKFIIVNGQYQAQTNVVGYTPVVAQSTGSATVNGYGNSAFVTGSTTTTYNGGTPITATSHTQGLVVKMFKEGDPSGSNALSARATLGPEWQKLAAEKTLTCLS